MQLICFVMEAGRGVTHFTVHNAVSVVSTCNDSYAIYRFNELQKQAFQSISTCLTPCAEILVLPPGA